MWIHVPCQFCHSAPASADSTSDCGWRSQLLASSVTSNGKAIASDSWLRGWRRGSWRRALFGLIYPPSTAEDGVARFVDSLPDTPASPSAWPGSGGGSPTPDTSGPTSPGSSPSAAPNSSSARTSPSIFVWASTRFTTSFDTWATALRLECSRLQGWERDTSGNASSYWPTPRVVTHRTSRRSLTVKGHWSAPGLEQAAELAAGILPREYRSEEELTPQARRMYLLSPLARLTRDGATWHEGHRGYSRLNTWFLEWLQGFPIDWTATGVSGTRWSHWWRRMRSEFCSRR